MTPPFVLDTSALLAHCLEESGYQIVEDLLEQHPDEVLISAMTWLEFQVRLEEIHPDSAARSEILECYADLLADPVPINKEVVNVALIIRAEVGRRLPNADAIIAATAKLRDATLVHRDPHLAAIPPTLVRQIVLPEKTKAIKSKK